MARLSARARVATVPWTTLALAGALAAGLALRIWIIVSPLGTLDSDEAVWGLMAQRTLDGHPSIFFWHQAYGGTHEVFALAAVFSITGPSVLAMRLTQIVLYAVAALLIWAVGRRTIGEQAARVAAALFWVWPAYLVWRSTREYGFYGSALILSLLVVLLVLRLRERLSLLDAGLLGLVFGLGWWATPQVGFVAIPAILWLVWRSPRVLRVAPVVIAAALTGAVPWFVWNLRNSWASFDVPPAAPHNTYWERLVEFVATTLPEILGLRVPFSLDWVVGRVPGRLITVAVIAGIVVLAWRRWGRPVEALVAIAVVYPFLYALSPYAWLITDPRYMTLLAPIAALLLAYVATRVGAAAVLLAAALALTVPALLAMERDRLPLAREEGLLVPRDAGPALRTLEAAGETRVRAPFWVAYRIEFESHQRVLVTPITIVVRDRHADALVRQDPHPAWVFVRGQRLERIHRATLVGEGYRRLVRDGWTIYVWPRTARAD